ncbi:MAG TPA: O-acetyl-ADP-ribose deacetylase [Bacteroidales bacterium]|nr:O-acetyl-ADP-ribose deacetylase [Bacteroidales bacterium]HPS62773.1 O-acetyl-ADP-ribose deacetylase [Bacteroidales bacterium]
METRIELIFGDITKFSADAIVNAANPSLLGGGGVDGAIHRAAGSGLTEVCKLLGGCRTGEAKITKGFKLPARFVIHTVGPVWGNGDRDEERLLANCYRNSLAQAVLHDCHTVAFPNISTGVYHFPKELAAEIAIREVRDFLSTHPIPEKVMFACFDEENHSIYQRLLSQ